MPGRQADGLLQEGEFWVVEAEDLVHHMGLGLHSQAEHCNGPATLHPEKNLQRWTCGSFVDPSGQHEELTIIPKVRWERQTLKCIRGCTSEGVHGLDLGCTHRHAHP